MAEQVLVIQGDDVALIQCISPEPLYYAKEVIGDDGKKRPSKMVDAEGKPLSYRRFNYGGKVFISNDESFRKDIDNGEVQKVTLGVNGEGQLSLTGWVTFRKLRGIRKNQVLLDSITAENINLALKLDRVEDFEEAAAE